MSERIAADSRWCPELLFAEGALVPLQKLFILLSVPCVRAAEAGRDSELCAAEAVAERSQGGSCSITAEHSTSREHHRVL